jgi:hypothetical protein
VQLVEATSKMPFPEHTKNGMHFVEAEPNADYYIRLEMIPCINLRNRRRRERKKLCSLQARVTDHIGKYSPKRLPLGQVH